MKKGFLGIIIIAAIILGGVYYFVNIRVEEDNKNKHQNKVEEKANPYVGGYKAEIKELYDEDNKEKYYVYLILRNDGTYTYGYNSVSGARKVGTYTVKDDSILLHDIVSYGSDACYVTRGEAIQERTLKIINKKTLEIDDYDTTLKFVFDGNLIETSFESSWYVTNPVNGESPEISDVDEYWTDCTYE